MQLRPGARACLGTVVPFALACAACDGTTEAGGREAGGTNGTGGTGPDGGGGLGAVAGNGGTGGDTTGGSGGMAGSGGSPFIGVDLLRPPDPRRCLPSPLTVGGPGTPEDGRVFCSVLEISRAACDCTGPGRAPAQEAETTAAKDFLMDYGLCEPDFDCTDLCGCEILQPAGTAADPSSALYACQNEVTLDDPDLVGFCYIDLERVDGTGAPAPLGNPEIVAQCPSVSRRQLRFVGADTPAANALTVLICEPP
jgi:hypothetical protein